jgi:hypothetical protein
MYGLVINNNPYGLMFALSCICRISQYPILEPYVDFKVENKVKKIKWWPRSDPKFGHEGSWKPMAIMSWRRRLSDISCISSRHQHNEERRKEVYVQYEPSHKKSFAWILLSLWWSWICEDIAKKRLSFSGVWEQSTGLHQESTIKKIVPSWCG